MCAAESDSPNPPGGVVAVIRDDHRFLVIQRGLQLVRAPGKYCFPGGTIELGETPLEALHREMQEELGVAIEPQGKIWTSLTPRGVHLEWWSTAIKPDSTIRACPHEVAWIGWLSADEMLDLEHLLPSNLEFLNQLRQGRIVLP